MNIKKKSDQNKWMNLPQKSDKNSRPAMSDLQYIMLFDLFIFKERTL